MHKNMSDITPRVDIAFKKIFGVEENKDLLISLINSIVGTEDQVSEVTYLNLRLLSYLFYRSHRLYQSNQRLDHELFS